MGEGGVLDHVSKQNQLKVFHHDGIMSIMFKFAKQG